MIELYKDLFNELNKSVRYTAWKDCHELERFLNGFGDVDLLVHPLDRTKFLKILNNFNFLEAKNPVYSFEDVHHYFGFDKISGRICHLNIYYSMTTGASHLKSHRLPLMDDLFKHREINSYGIFEATFDYQAIIHAMRHHLKRASLFGTILWLKQMKGYKKEYEYILKGLGKDGLKYNLEFVNNLGLSSGYYFSSLHKNNVIKTFFQSLKCVKELKKYRRFNGFKTALKSLKNTIIFLLVRQFKIRKVFKSGQVIAISGIDGAGKTSMVMEIKDWFDEHFKLKIFHVGRPPFTIFTALFRIPLYLKKILYVPKSKAKKNSVNFENNTGFIYAIRYLILALERKKNCDNARKLASIGGIAITDRYAGKTIGKMDCPRIGYDLTGIIGLLGQLEIKTYERIIPSDLLIYLDVNLEKAIKRNQLRDKVDKESDDEIRSRHLINKEIEFITNSTVVVDANQSYEEVLSNIKILIWNHISKGNK